MNQPLRPSKRRSAKKIESVKINGNTLQLYFTDKTWLNLKDDGQSCCESRYMSADQENLGYFTGSTLMEISLASGPDKEGEYGDHHEIQFLNIKTSKGIFQVANHVEHNGYYGGFWIVAELRT